MPDLMKQQKLGAILQLLELGFFLVGRKRRKIQSAINDIHAVFEVYLNLGLFKERLYANAKADPPVGVRLTPEETVELAATFERIDKLGARF